MTKWLAQQTLEKMRFDLSISRPGAAMNEKMALEMAIDALGVQQEEEIKGCSGECDLCQDADGCEQCGSV